jgi:hypothetical protein
MSGQPMAIGIADPQQTLEVTRWRRAERERLIAARLKLDPEYRAAQRMTGKPLVIGLGYPYALINTIYPQPHDIPMNWIVTGANAPLRRAS